VEQRRFTLRHLRDLGFGKKSLEGIILDEAEVLIKKLQYNEIQVTSTFDLT
jgi:methyl farnesoate epoxidase/farnesoate epoxidase